MGVSGRAPVGTVHCRLPLAALAASALRADLGVLLAGVQHINLPDLPYIRMLYCFSGKAYDLVKTTLTSDKAITGTLKPAWGAPAPFIGNSLKDFTMPSATRYSVSALVSAVRVATVRIPAEDGFGYTYIVCFCGPEGIFNSVGELEWVEYSSRAEALDAIFSQRPDLSSADVTALVSDVRAVTHVIGKHYKNDPVVSFL